MDIFRKQKDILCTKKYLCFIFNSNITGYPVLLLYTATLNTSFLVVESLEPIYNRVYCESTVSESLFFVPKFRMKIPFVLLTEN